MAKLLLWRFLIPGAAICLLLGYFPAVAGPRSAQQAAISADLDAKYKDKLVMLRRSYCEHELRFDAAGNLASTRIQLADWAICQGMRIRQLSLNGRSLRISAQRIRLFYDCAESAFRELTESDPQPDKEPQSSSDESVSKDVVVEAPLPAHADEATIIKLMDKLFYISSPGPDEAIPESVITGVNPASKDGPFHIGYGVIAPVAVYYPEPDYSEEARRAGYQGTVTLTVIIGLDGRVHNPRVVRALGMGLDEKAIEKVSTWRFKPATKCAKPVPIEMQIEIQFHLVRRL